MKKVISINLNGRAFQVEEGGYEALRKYLDQAEAKLANDPDKTEIMADFEQAIADKCSEKLSGSKDVVSTAEIEEIIAKMGPVVGGKDGETAGQGAGAGSGNGENNSSTTGPNGHGSSSRSRAPKKLYQIRQGAWLAGVCAGLAAYFNVDVSLMRLIFVALTVLTHGPWILVYIILAIVLPIARTPDELDQAFGKAPFNAQDFIEQAKARYGDFKKNPPENTGDWVKWKQDMKNWKRELKQDMRRTKWERRHGKWEDPAYYSYGGGFFRFLMGIMMAIFVVLLVGAIITIVKHSMIFGIAFAAGYPLWVPIVFICALFYIVMTPFRLFIKNSRPFHWGRYSFFNDLMQSIFFLIAIYLLIYTGRELFPVVNAAYGMVKDYVIMILK